MLTDAELESKALRITAILEEHTLQDHGMVPMFVRASDYQLPTDEDYAGAYRHRHLHGKSESELGLPPMYVWRAWEDTSANTALYLGALSFQYRCTGNPDMLRRCHRTLGAIQYIYDLGAKTVKPGFLCKPYGGKASNQTSEDQLQCVTVGLDTYRRIAGSEDAALITRMFKGFAEFQISCDYYQPGRYFGVVDSKPRYTLRSGERQAGKDWLPGSLDWSIGIIWALVMRHAWLDSGEVRYLREIERVYAGCGLDQTPSEGSGRSTRHLYLPSLMMEIDPWHHEVWRPMMLSSFRNARESIEPDGTQIVSFSGPGLHRTGRSSQWARGMVSAQRWFPNEPMVDVARHILESLDMSTFRFVMPLTGKTLSPEWKVESEMLDHDSLVPWLFAYWEGRYYGYW